MQPELVAQTLTRVEDSWLHQATPKCDDTSPDCMGDFQAFQSSCRTVTMSIVQGSSGDRNVVQEYMSRVCDEGALPQDWHRDRCQDLATSLLAAMKIDSADNRDMFDSTSVCAHLWTALQADAKDYIEKERAVRAAAEAQAEERSRREEEERAKHIEADSAVFANASVSGTASKQGQLADGQAESSAQALEDSARKTDVTAAPVQGTLDGPQGPASERNSSQLVDTHLVTAAPEVSVSAAPDANPVSSTSARDSLPTVLPTPVHNTTSGVADSLRLSSVVDMGNLTTNETNSTTA